MKEPATELRKACISQEKKKKKGKKVFLYLPAVLPFCVAYYFCHIINSGFPIMPGRKLLT